MKRQKLKNLIKKTIQEEKPGLWANIRAKRAKVGKKGMAKKGSKAYKDAKKAGDEINKTENKDSSNLTIGNYQTKHFDICPGAYNLYNNIEKGETEVEDKDLVVRVAKLHDSLFYLEKMVIQMGIEPTPELVEVAQNTADLIMSGAEKMGLKKEHGYIQNHVDRIKSEMNEISMTINEVLVLEIDEDITEAKYKGKTVQLNKPTRGDSKKFKVYVNSGKKNADGSIKVKKVNFGHGGTSAKKAGQKTLKIRKSNPKARAAFRARHKCDNPGPKTMARYWSCKKW